MEGAEVHGLSMGKKSPPKIDRDLREGTYIQAFMSMKTEEQGMAGKSLNIFLFPFHKLEA